MKKIIMVSLLIFGTANATYFDNSVDRWEMDCNLKGGSGSNCTIAARMYERGNWEDANTGKITKIKGTKTPRIQKAKALYKRACKKGNKEGCEKAKLLR